MTAKDESSETTFPAGTAPLILESPAATERWQKRLLPLMVRMVVGLTVFFFIATLAQLFYLHRAIQHAPVLDLTPILNPAKGSPELGVSGEFRIRALLEANVLDRRYHQANVFLMSRVWVHYLGFVTGMILAFVGAVFILGKLRTEASEIAAEGGGAGMNLRSTSPGIVLAVLGVVLMGLTIVTNHPIVTADAPLFLGSDKPELPNDHAIH